jgi:hypothetical protein
MGRKKLLMFFIFTFLLFIGIILKLFFFGNIVFLWDMNDDKTTHVDVGNTLIISPLSPIDAVYFTNNDTLRPVLGVTEVSAAAPPTPYVYGVTHKGKPTFRVVSTGSVEIFANVPNLPGRITYRPQKVYHFKVIADE